MQNDHIRKLAGRFHLHVRRAETVKTGVYRLLSTDGNEYCLKRMRYSEARIRWIDDTLRRLRQNGFTSIAWREPQTAAGSLLTVKNNQKIPYILTPWLAGRQPSAASEDELKACARRLAEFHQAGSSLLKQDTSPAPGALNLLGKWPQQLRQRRNQLARTIRQANTQSKAIGKQQSTQMLSITGKTEPLHETWASLLHRQGTQLLSRADDALQLLQISSYQSLCLQAAQQGTLCHGDSGPKNFVLTEEGPALIDFETLRIDLPVYDLFRMIRLSCKGNGWPFHTARHILDGYRDVTELTAADYQLLQVWLLFPHKACKLAARFNATANSATNTDTRRNLHDRFSRDLAKALRDEQNVCEFLQELKTYATER